MHLPRCGDLLCQYQYYANISYARRFVGHKQTWRRAVRL